MATVADPVHYVARPVGRIAGLDVSRAVAMLAMVVVHYIWPDDSGHALDVVARSLSGRAMPLFVLLGGVGVSLASARSAMSSGDLLRRAGVLFTLGLVLHEMSEWVAVILQSYGVFFAASPLLRRLSDQALLGAAAGVAVVGSVTYRTVGAPSQPTTFADLLHPVDTVTSLLFDGYYPFFPVACFFLLGLWVGRLDLGTDRVATRLAGIGAVVGLGGVLAANRLVEWLDVDTTQFGTSDGPFAWGRLLDHTGHSQMPAWVLSAAATSIAVIGLCLLVTPRLGSLASPLVAVGALPLTFYAFQVVLTLIVPDPRSTSFDQELVTVALIFVGFTCFAYWWRRRFRSGPLEALLRVGSARPR